MTLKQLGPLGIRPCLVLVMRRPDPCNNCVLHAATQIDSYKRVCVSCTCPSSTGPVQFYGTYTDNYSIIMPCHNIPSSTFFVFSFPLEKTERGESTIVVSDQLSFCCIAPYSGSTADFCIRSLPAAAAGYIYKCFPPITVSHQTIRNISHSVFDE